MKLQNLALALGLAALGVTQQVTSASALTWNWTLTNGTFNGTTYNGGGTFTTTTSNTYDTTTQYQLSGISGQVNGSAITGVDSTTSYGSVVPDNKFKWNGVNGLLLDSNGVGFKTAAHAFNPFSASASATTFLNADSLGVDGVTGNGFNATYTLTPTSVGVPWDFSPTLGLALGVPLFIGLRIRKNRLARKSAARKSTVAVS